MRRSDPPLGLQCPECGSSLELVSPPTQFADTYSMWCQTCARTFRARPRTTPGPRKSRRPIGNTMLLFRSELLRGVFGVYRLGVGLGTVGLFLLGGFVPVVRGWLNDSVASRADLLPTLGGPPVSMGAVDADADLGPILKRSEAPRLFDILSEVANQLEVRPPEQVRLAFLPC